MAVATSGGVRPPPPTSSAPLAPLTPQTAAKSVATPRPDAGNAAELVDLIRVTEPSAGQLVTSPLVIRGVARGTWFFEASFPLTLEGADGSILGSTIATALGEWMTEEFVPFEATLTFQVPVGTAHGRLILAKDNPSGLPEHDAQLQLPVRLAP